MKLRFIHTADIHLGHEQYNLAQRSDDFAHAFLSVVQHAISVRADFMLLAGDLFHHARADAWTLKQATAGLETLRDAGIPVVAIEGNHDVQHYYKNLSWMEYLCDSELLILLNMRKDTNGFKALVPFDPEERRGSWIDIAGARIYGLKYLGVATARVLEELSSSLEPGPGGFTVMTLHTGMEGQIPHMHGGLTFGQIEALRPAVDYLALGHVHKRLQTDWVFNPGSLETNSMEEMDWEHGFFDVTVDTDSTPKHVATPVDYSGRPFRRVMVNADGTETLDQFVEIVERRIESHRSIPEGAVIELALGGIGAFRRQDLPLERLKAAVERRFSPLVVRIRNTLAPPGLVPASSRERLSRSDLERRVVGQLVNQMAEFRQQSDAWTRLILDIKNMAVERDLPAAIADHVRHALPALDLPPAPDEDTLAEPPPHAENAAAEQAVLGL